MVQANGKNLEVVAEFFLEIGDVGKNGIKEFLAVTGGIAHEEHGWAIIESRVADKPDRVEKRADLLGAFIGTVFRREVGKKGRIDVC